MTLSLIKAPVTLTDRIIAYVALHPTCSAWETAKALRADASSVSSQLKRLVDRGILRRESGWGEREEAWGYWWLGKPAPIHTSTRRDHRQMSRAVTVTL